MKALSRAWVWVVPAIGLLVCAFAFTPASALGHATAERLAAQHDRLRSMHGIHTNTPQAHAHGGMRGHPVVGEGSSSSQGAGRDSGVHAGMEAPLHHPFVATDQARSPPHPSSTVQLRGDGRHSVNVQPPQVCLSPGQLLSGQHIVARPGNSVAYCLRQLEPQVLYEAKLSYPATRPAHIDVTVTHACGAGSTSGSQRRLLNTAKAEFETDGDGVPVVSQDMGAHASPGCTADTWVVVHAWPEAVPPGFRNAEHAAMTQPVDVPYSIVVEPVQAVARRALAAIVPAIVLAVAVLACLLAPASSPFLRPGTSHRPIQPHDE